MAKAIELLTLAKGLRALRYINESGPINLASVARRLGLPRTNTHRILQTFVSEGYVERVPNSKLFRLTSSVKYLSDGCDTEETLTAVAQPLISDLGDKILWPIAVATPRGPTMVVQASTDYQSPLALTRFRPGYSTPMLRTTTGLLYLALSPLALRDATLKVIRAEGREPAEDMSSGKLDMVMRSAREKHYLIRDSNLRESCLGVPLVSGNRVIGGVVLRYIQSVISREQVVDELLSPLQTIAARIVMDYEMFAQRR